MPLIVVLVPVAVIAVHLAMVWYAFGDLYRPDRRVRTYDKTVWAVLIGFVALFGPIAYWYTGRENP